MKLMICSENEYVLSLSVTSLIYLSKEKKKNSIFQPRPKAAVELWLYVRQNLKHSELADKPVRFTKAAKQKEKICLCTVFFKVANKFKTVLKTIGLLCCQLFVSFLI